MTKQERLERDIRKLAEMKAREDELRSEIYTMLARHGVTLNVSGETSQPVCAALSNGKLRSLGYEIVEDSEEVREVRIPDEPDEVLLQYDALQESTGRSLVEYGGKRVRLYSYDIADGGAAHLYVYRDRIVAGDVENEGEMQPIQ